MCRQIGMLMGSMFYFLLYRNSLTPNYLKINYSNTLFLLLKEAMLFFGPVWITGLKRISLLQILAGHISRSTGNTEENK